MMRFVLALFALACAGEVAAATVTDLLNRPVANLKGETVGPVDELIVDVAAGRVVYILLDGRDRFYTLPIGALDERLRVDMARAGDVARDRTPSKDPRYRRAGKLIGQPVTNPGGGRIGAIADFEFDIDTGRVQQVVVSTDEGRRNFPPSVLRHGRFPPLTRWQVEHPSADVADRMGFVRRPPSDDRQRLHEHEW